MKAWILQNQLARRNLEAIDRVAVVTQLKAMLEEQAKKRQGQRTDLVPNWAQSSNAGKTRDKLADMAGVSHRTFDNATKVLDKGAPAVQQAVREEALSLSAAVPLTELPRAWGDGLGLRKYRNSCTSRSRARGGMGPALSQGITTWDEWVKALNKGLL